MVELSDEQVEELRFRQRLERSHQASVAVAAYLQSQGWLTEIPPIRIRPSFDQRQFFRDKGDVFIWHEGDPQKLKVEVKWRNLAFTCAEDFPFHSINIDRVSKPNLASLYVSTNRDLTHALIVHLASRANWRVEMGTDPTRQYTPYEIYRCSKNDAEFVALLPSTIIAVPDPPRPKPPDLQEWVARYGGYWKIPWPEWDEAISQWREAMRQLI